MAEKRLAVNLNEVLYLEIYCDSCKSTTSLSIEERPGTIPTRKNKDDAALECLSCHRSFRDVPQFQQIVTAIGEGLKLHRNLTDQTFSVSLIVKE